MIVKIGDEKFDSVDEPILVILSGEEIDYYAKQGQVPQKFFGGPDTMSTDEIFDFIEEKKQ